MYSQPFRILSLLGLLALLLASGSGVQAEQTPAANAQWPLQNVQFVGQLGGLTGATEVQGDYAYIGIGLYLAILDV